MKTYPENAIELMDMFPDEEACLDYLSTIRWPHGYLCIRCGDKVSVSTQFDGAFVTLIDGL